MPRIDLITGFLGSGKTTLLKLLAEKRMEQGQNIGILENDFGAVNVDTMLLQDLEGEQCEIEMVAGGCDYDCHRRRFKTKLIAMGMVGYDTVLVEPSGVYDVDEFFDVLWEDPLDRWYRIGSVIAVVDAGLEENLSEEAEYLLVSQIARAGLIVLSRVQETSDEQIAGTIAHLNRALEKFGCDRRITAEQDVLIRDWAKFNEEDLDRIRQAGYRQADHRKMPVDRENGFQTLYYMHVNLHKDALLEAVRKIMEDPACGQVFRMKGFLRAEAATEVPADVSGNWLQLNATRENLHTEPASAGQEVIIVIGEKLQEDVISAYLGKQAGTL